MKEARASLRLLPPAQAAGSRDQLFYAALLRLLVCERTVFFTGARGTRVPSSEMVFMLLIMSKGCLLS